MAVVPDLVAALHDLAAEIRIALDDPGGDVPAGLDAVPVEDLEDAGRAGLRPVGAHGHVQRPLGQGGVTVDPRALPVEVERDGERTPLALGPLDRRLLHAFLRALGWEGYTVRPREVSRAAQRVVFRSTWNSATKSR